MIRLLDCPAVRWEEAADWLPDEPPALVAELPGDVGVGDSTGGRATVSFFRALFAAGLVGIGLWSAVFVLAYRLVP